MAYRLFDTKPLYEHYESLSIGRLRTNFSEFIQENEFGNTVCKDGQFVSASTG